MGFLAGYHPLAMPDRLPLPANRSAVLDLYFAEHRAKLLDIASFLDRADRAAGDGPEDFRLAAFRKALEVAGDGRPQRARRILELLSDPTTEPIEAAGTKGAAGAWRGMTASGARRS
jgi:hypothetical protein